MTSTRRILDFIIYYLPLFVPLFVAIYSVAVRWASGILQLRARDLLRIYADLAVGIFSFLVWASVSFIQRGRIALNPDLAIPPDKFIILLILSAFVGVGAVGLLRGQPKIRNDCLMLVFAIFVFVLPILLARTEPEQFKIRFLSSRDVAGKWTWDYPEEKWRGEMSFLERQGKLTVQGSVFQFQDHPKRKLLYEIREGTAEIVRQKDLTFRCKVRDFRHGRDLIWETEDPLTSGLAFKGIFRATRVDKPDPVLRTYDWGISLLKASQ